LDLGVRATLSTKITTVFSGKQKNWVNVSLILCDYEHVMISQKSYI